MRRFISFLASLTRFATLVVVLMLACLAPQAEALLTSSHPGLYEPIPSQAHAPDLIIEEIHPLGYADDGECLDLCICVEPETHTRVFYIVKSPTGLAVIIVSGGIADNPKQDFDHDYNWRNFVDAARAMMRQYNGSLVDGEKIEWIVERDAYEKRALVEKKPKDYYTKAIEKMALSEGTVLRWFNDQKQFAQALNMDTIGLNRSGLNLINFIEIFSHGGPGALSFTWGTEGNGSFRTKDVKTIDPKAFSSVAQGRSWACYSATPQDDRTPSVIDAWSGHLGIRMTGATGKTEYGGVSGVRNSRKKRALVTIQAMGVVAVSEDQDAAIQKLKEMSGPQLPTLSSGIIHFLSHGFNKWKTATNETEN